MCIRHFYTITPFAITSSVGVVLGLALRRKTIIIVERQLCVLTVKYLCL